MRFQNDLKSDYEYRLKKKLTDMDNEIGKTGSIFISKDYKSKHKPCVGSTQKLVNRNQREA